MRTPLPSNTHGPASLRGVIGPSCPFSSAGLPDDVGDGVLVSPRPVAAAPEEVVRAVGIGTGLEVAFVESWLVERPGRELGVVRVSVGAADCGLVVVVVVVVVAGGVSESCSIMVTSIASGSRCCAAAAAVAGTAAAAGSRDVRGVCDGWPPGPDAGPALAVGSSEAPSCPLASSSEASCSHSSGSSTSASRSAAARQFGQMKMG